MNAPIDTKKPILIYAVGSNNQGRPIFHGEQFKSVRELQTMVKNIGGFHRAAMVVNGTLYGLEDIKQAIADTSR